MEHRWGERVCVNHSVRVSAPHWRAVAQLINVSASGAYLLGVPPPPRITTLSIAFGSRQQRVLIEAHVVRTARDGFALEWCDFAPRIVSELIARAATSEADLRRSA